MFAELDLKPTRQKLVEFAGGMIFVSLLAIPLLIYFLNGLENGLWIPVAAVGFIASAIFATCRWFAPMALIPLYVPWVGLSVGIGMIIGPLLLTLIYYLVVTPIGLLSRMTGKVWIDTEEKKTYWTNLEPHSKDKFERQF